MSLMPPLMQNNHVNCLNDGMDADDNVDMFLNLYNIEGIEISLDSTKRERCEKGRKLPPKPPNSSAPIND